MARLASALVGICATIAATSSLALAVEPSPAAPATQPATRPTGSAAVAAMRTAGGKFLVAARRDGRMWEQTAAPVAGNKGFAGDLWGVVSAAAGTAVYWRNDVGLSPNERWAARDWLLQASLSTEAKAMAVHTRLWPAGTRTTDRSAADAVWIRGLADAVAAQDLSQAKAADARRAWEISLVGGQALMDRQTYHERTPAFPGLGQQLDRQWRGLQRPDGSWGLPGSTSVADDARVTARAVALLLTARPDASVDDPAVARGLAWLDARDPRDLLDVETLVALERCAQQAGRRGFGRLDLGGGAVDHLRALQNADGSFGNAADPSQRLLDTALAIDFLNRVDVPVLFAKLRYGPGDNRNPRDLVHLTADASRWLCAWGLCAWRTASVDDDLAATCDAPVLFICGTAPPRFDDARVGRLRRYVERGGLIVGVGDGDSPAFAGWFRELAGRAFPGRPFRALPDGTPVTGWWFRSDAKKKPTLLGVSNGVRELMVLVPHLDAGRRWQAGDAEAAPLAFRVGLSIYTYTVGNGSGITRWPDLSAPPPAAKPIVRTLRVGVASTDPAGSPEPHAWRRMAAQLAASDGVGVEAYAVDLKGDLAKLTPADLPLVHLSGTQRFALTADQLAALAKYARDGGTLLVDAAGASPAFAADAAAALAAMFGEAGAAGGRLLPADDPMLAGARTVSHGDWIGWRRPYADDRKEMALRGLRVIPVEGRPAVLFSSVDLSAGMAGLRHDGFAGYDVPAATAIAREAALLAARR